MLFDCLVFESKKIMQWPMIQRYNTLKTQLYPAFQAFMSNHFNVQMEPPFEIQIKSMKPAYEVDVVLKDIIPSLQHKSDGLIFTNLSSPYKFGTNPQILKWKPPQQVTVDFQLKIHPRQNVKVDSSGKTLDSHAKPLFQLLQNNRGSEHVSFAWFEMCDDEWEHWKNLGSQLDEQVVECAWHPPSAQNERYPTWHIKRLRSDKKKGNHKSVVAEIMQCMANPVTEQKLLDFVPKIRQAWESPRRMALRDVLYNGVKV